ncbi:SGNH/GDSL hydrolase family protein [Weissella paramesenteroides]|uniref:SGNH/GDSL hydrolase family protein n=1 Tax=Weissella paramesenteroides TaxID=1249 RepID=UPI0023F8CAF9|nr:SGNH/GDSL hydrolase family protein [Weissella paramesenteroides]MDF8372264.1 SGNH/GDSL hydrolase family protein [Weissella paramesenteroides]WIG66051.1 SGNH/GDSL hydrolase family protein [Weissella paramesenteroides]
MEVRSKVKKILGQWRHKQVQNDWTNKNIVVFGDSIVAGQELVREETPYRDAVYAKLASYYLNAHKLENFAETGTGQFKGQHHLDHLTGWTHSFEGSIQHYNQEIKWADVVLIAYGNNDWKQPNPDGSLHTLDEVKVKLRENIQRIRLINHHVQLVGVLETLAFRKHKPAWHLEGPNGFTYQEMLLAFIDVYQECDVPIFDIRDYHLGNHMDEYVDDRDHFTLSIHKQIAKSLADFVCHGYQSPTQRFGEAIKFIFPDNLFEDSKMRQLLFSEIRKQSLQGKRTEILWFVLDENYQEKLVDLLSKNTLPADLKITNIYQYYAAPLRYTSELDELSLKEGELFNSNNVPFIRFSEEKQISIKGFDDIWSDLMTSEQFNELWLKHYISLKDQVYVWRNKQFVEVDPLEL